MQSLQGLGLPFIMSIEEFDAQVAWPGDQPSSFGGGGASAAQERDIEEPPAAVAAEREDKFTPPEPFYFEADVHMAQEEGTSTD